MIRTLNYSSLSRIAFVGLLLVAARAANAAVIHGNFPAATVDYIGVQEHSSTDPDPVTGFFGPPTIAGDAMDFNPQGFAASSNGLAADITDSNLQFMIKAHQGKSITGFFFSETGDTQLVGAADAFSTVSTTLVVEIAEVDNLPVSYNVPVAGLVFGPSGGTYQLSVDGAPFPFYQTPWTGSQLVDLGPTIALNGITGAVTKVNVSIDNTLSAASQVGSAAFIQKKDADGVAVTIVVNTAPEPTSAVVALIGLALGGGMIRRRR